MSGQFLEDIIERTQTQGKVKPELKAPRKFKVFLLNDDYTPMDFVVEVLNRFFHMGEAMATMVMLQVHTQGKAVCGIFTHEIAETKVALVNEYARINEYPLLSSMEPE
jgi:ATP-dependent Clp protease adaptor protein ClpS